MSNAARQETATPQASPNTCIVACKLPHGLKLELWDKPAGSKVRSVVGSFTLKGSNASRTVGGYALTEGIPTEFMAAWFKQNGEHPAVKNGSIFMHSGVRDAEAQAKDGREIRTGLEAIDPLNGATQKRFGIGMDREGEAAYRKQVAENPMRDRQQAE